MEFPSEPKAMTSKRQNRSDSRRATAALPADYNALLVDIKNRIRTAQIRASSSVNRELIQLYWENQPPHRRAAASSRMGQVGGRLEDARLLFGLDRGRSKSLTGCERNRWWAPAVRCRGNSLLAQHDVDLQVSRLPSGSCNRGPRPPPEDARRNRCKDRLACPASPFVPSRNTMCSQ